MGSEDDVDILHGLRGRSLVTTHDWSTAELDVVLNVANRFEQLDRAGGCPPLLPFELASAVFAEPSTRTAASWAGAATRLGMHAVTTDVGAGDELAGAVPSDPVELGAMLAASAHAIGVRHPGALGAGDAFVRGVHQGVAEHLVAAGIERPVPVVSLQSDVDHPTRALADLLWLEERAGSQLSGRTVAVTWANSTSGVRPLSVPQGLISLLPRFGAHVRLAHPPGYDLQPEAMRWAIEGARAGGGTFEVVDRMEDALAEADAVCATCWAPMVSLRQRAAAVQAGDADAVAAADAHARDLGASHRDWICDDDRLALTADAVYLHPLPVEVGAEVSPEVYRRHRANLARQAAKQMFVVMALFAVTKVDGLAGRI